MLLSFRLFLFLHLLTFHVFLVVFLGRKEEIFFSFPFLTLGFFTVFVFISLLLYTIKSRLQVTTKCSSRHFGSFGPGHCSNVEDAIVNESDPFV